MVIENQSASSTPEVVSDDNQKENQTKKEKDVVSYESHQKLLGQLKNTKEQAKLMEEKLNLFEQKQKEIEESKLAEKGEYQKLLELRQNEIADLKAKVEAEAQEKFKASKALEDTWKLQSFYDKLPGKVKRREYLNFVDLDAIAFNPDTGQIDDQSVDIVVNDFMKNHKDLVDTKSFGKLPGDAPSSMTTIDAQTFKNLSLKDMKLKMKDAVQAAKRKQGVK